MRDGLGSGRHLELGEHVVDVVAHGLRRQHPAAGDLGVGQAARDQVEDLALTFGQFGERDGGRRRSTPAK